jgi:hypothetical protein
MYAALNLWFWMAVCKTDVLASVIGLIGINRHLKDGTA